MRRTLSVCVDSKDCANRGANALFEAAQALVAQNRELVITRASLDAPATELPDGDERIRIQVSRCLGKCDQGPNVNTHCVPQMIARQGSITVTGVTPARLGHIVTRLTHAQPIPIPSGFDDDWNPLDEDGQPLRENPPLVDAEGFILGQDGTRLG